MDFDVIIIGGGLGGLSAGAILSRHGKKVLLLEQHYIPGGCATVFKRKDFVMEAGLHAMDGHLIDKTTKHSVLRYLGISKMVDFQKLPEFFHIQNARIDFTFPNGPEEAISSLIQAYPGEEKGIRKFFSLVLGVQDELSQLPKNTWEKIWKFPLFPFLFPNILKTFSRTAAYYLDRYFTSEELKLVMQANLLYYHDDPYSLSMIFFAKAQASFIQHGGFFIKGGSQKLSDSLAEVIKENHGKVLLGKRVEKILVKNRKAAGVIFRDAFNQHQKPETMHASHIIHSGAIPLVTGLLEGTEREKIKRKIAKLVPSCSLFCVYIGFSREIKSLGNRSYSTFIYGDKLGKLKDVHENYYGPWDQRSFVFVDYSQIDAGLSPPGKSFGVICTADRLSDWEELDEEEYKKKKEEAARILLERLEKAIPGVNEAIEAYEIGTSRTIKRYTLNPYASPYGYAQTPVQAGFKRPSYRSPVKNLWFSGTWTFPGGGFTGAIVSGFLCGLQVSKKLEKGKDLHPEGIISDPRMVKLLQKREVATDTLELTFQKPAGFHYLPGQYAYLNLKNPAYTDLDIPLRALSIASHPDEESLRFVMRSGKSSYKKSCKALQEGDGATIYGPLGKFTHLPAASGMVFLVAGIGISPIIPMLQELELMDHEEPVYLFYSNKTEDQAAYHQQLRNRGIKKYKYHPIFTGMEDRINIRTLEDNVVNPLKMTYYIVGSSAFLSSMIEILLEMKVSKDKIYTDDFG